MLRNENKQSGGTCFAHRQGLIQNALLIEVQFVLKILKSKPKQDSKSAYEAFAVWFKFLSFKKLSVTDKLCELETKMGDVRGYAGEHIFFPFVIGVSFKQHSS